MNVQNKIMYHITKSDAWNIGDVIISGKIENPFWSRCKNIYLSINWCGKKISVVDFFEAKPDMNGTKECVDYLTLIIERVLQETSLYIREQTFEEVRRTEFSQLPSR